ncbi:unannotated protein [freshwater metagenome]|uniref:Unannotated protein n=1 Tax=freshwater metagenome TaxID=449393 RepID=A0A6J7J7I8_9ZZZZ|nr:EamA family transporter [Actinomycetota bacterium]
MTAILLALMASGLWGTSDFIGGLRTRTSSVFGVLLVIESVSIAVTGIVVIVSGDPFPDWGTVALAAGTGLCGAFGLLFFYQALAIGTMSIVAPISACGVVIPVLVGLISGDPLTALVAAGIVLALAGVVLASLEATVTEERQEHTRRSRLSIVLALASALGFGGYFVFSDSAADVSIPWLIFLMRLVVLPPLLAFVLLRRPALPARGDRPLLLVAAGCDAGATALYAIAQTHGVLSVVSMVGALYPVMTVTLARVVLAERLRRVQAAGITLAFIGIALLAAG